MNWLFPSVIATMIGTILLSLTYFYLYLTDHKKYLGIWTISWAIYTTRFIFMLFLIQGYKSPIFLIGNQITTLISGIIFLWGTYCYIDKKFPKTWVYLTIANIGWIIASIIENFSFLFITLPTFSFLAIIYITTGILFLKTGRHEKKESALVGGAFILWGIHKADYPFLRPVLWLAPWGYLLGAMLEFVVALGMLMIYFQKTRNELKKNEEKYRLAMDATADGIWDWQIQTGKVHYSKSWQTILKEDAVKPAYEFWESRIHPDDKPGVLSSIEKHLEGKTLSWNKEHRLRTKGGEWKWVLGRGRVVEKSPEGGPLRMVGTMTDISDLKQAEQELNRIFELSPDLIGVGNVRDGYYKRVNPAYKIFGRPLDEFLSRPYMDFIHPDDHNPTADLVRTMQSGQPISGFVNRYRCKDGSYRTIEWHATPAEADGTTYVAGRDITDRQKAESALRESEERFVLAMEFANDGLFDWNLETNEIYYSPVWKRMLGYENDELPNDFSVWETLTAPEDVKRSWKMQNELINKQRDRFELEFKMKHKDGHWVDILSRANAIFDKNNKAVRLIGTHVDISERKKLENQLLQSQKLESIGNLAGGIAHEFNNILSIIIGNNELIMEDLPKWSISRENCEEIRVAGLRARDIVRHLLTFSRQDDSTKKPIDIMSVVTESLKLIRSTTPTNIEIRDKISPNCLPILGDATQINQILINLCSNAIDALPISGGIINIELRNSEVDQHNGVSAHKLPKGKYIKLMVRDNGSGMPQKILDRIFEPYFTTKDVGKGSGIGLAVVHGIIENHGGLITCESAKGEGTTFTILLPAYEGLVDEDREQKNALPGKGERVLYVDDEPSIAKLGKRHLESLGYDAHSTTDPKKALEMIKAEPDRFDLVISDMAMPMMPGDQLIEEILSVNSKMPTMVCSGYSSRMSETKALEMGIKAFVMKPLNKNELAKKVRDVLDNSSKMIVK
nr:PAS domain-containing protein [uncultured Desulfobacter sp.]